MYINLAKNLKRMERNLPSTGTDTLKSLNKLYDMTVTLRSQLLALIHDEETFGEAATQEQEPLAQRLSHGECPSTSEVFFIFYEPLPALRELTSAMEDHWINMLQTAIEQVAAQQELPCFEKAYVEIEIITTKGHKNAKLWDTSNRAINVIINNLKGVFFHDDNMEHMAFSVVGYWGEKPATIVRVSEFDESKRIGLAVAL